MEGNKDEALRCVELAEENIAMGKYDKADKFLNKAQKLFPTSKAEALLESLKNLPRTRKESASPSRNKSGPSTAQSEQPQAKATYTTEQLEAVRRINKCKDFYQILGVTKESTDSEIKKAYKKLALQVHPDKNKAPGSVEAFKSLGNAAAILTDAEKRKRYDMFGDDSQQQRPQSRYQTYQNGFEADISPDEIFNLFFGGGYGGSGVYMRQRRGQEAYRQQRQAGGGGGQQQPQTSYGALINLLPILILIALSMMSSVFVSDPIFSLTPSLKHSVPRVTNGLKVTYYVKDNFHSEYSGSVARLEASVEEEYLSNLKHSCYRERNYKDAQIMKARSLGDRELFNRAKSLTTPSCDQLGKYRN